jgi:hypothetical protein
MLRPILAAASLALVAGMGFGCSKGLFGGDTSFREAEKGFDGEMTPAQRKAICRTKQTGKRNNLERSAGAVKNARLNSTIEPSSAASAMWLFAGRGPGASYFGVFGLLSRGRSPDLNATLASVWALRVSIAKTADDREQRGQGKDENHQSNECVYVPNGTRHVRYSSSYAYTVLS